MGMYDHIRCEVPLPGLPDPSKMEFQTKDLECMLENYTINKDGRLIFHFKEYEATPEDELPYKDDPNPIMRFCGSIRVVKGSEKDVDKNYEGTLNFYGNERTGELCAIDPLTGEDKFHPGPRPEWFEYDAKFVDGKIVSVVRRENV